jgi:hypothetical protein
MLDGEISELLVGVAELLLGLPARAVRLLQHRLCFLERVLRGMCASLRVEHVVSRAILRQLFRLELERLVAYAVLQKC